MGHWAVVAAAQNAIGAQRDDIHFGSGSARDKDGVVPVGYIFRIYDAIEIGQVRLRHHIVGGTVIPIRAQADLEDKIVAIVGEENVVVGRVDRQPGRLARE